MEKNNEKRNYINPELEKIEYVTEAMMDGDSSVIDESVEDKTPIIP